MTDSIRVFASLLAVAIVGGLMGGCATKGKPTDPLEEPMESAPPMTSSAEPMPAFDSNGNPYVPGTTDLLTRTFYFEYDRSVLRPEAMRNLKAHARTLVEHPDRNVVIEGHADERGTRDYNLALGERRADAVRLFLVSSGVASEQIEIVSYGEEKPDDTRHNEAAWSRNRRASMIYQSQNGARSLALQ